MRSKAVIHLVSHPGSSRTWSGTVIGDWRQGPVVLSEKVAVDP